MRRVLPPVHQSDLTTTTSLLMAHSEKFVTTIGFARLVTYSASIQKQNFEMAIVHKISILHITEFQLHITLSFLFYSTNKIVLMLN